MRTHTLTRVVAERIFVPGAGLILPLLPRRLILALARVLGRCSFHLLSRYRNRALANLDLVYGDSLSPNRKREIAASAFQSFALVALDLFWFSRRTAGRIKRWVRFDPSFHRYFETAPLIVVSGHFGNWEVLGLAVAVVGSPVAVPMAPTGSPVLDGTLTRIRRLTGQTVFPKDGAVRRMLRTLRAGGRTAVFIDQNLHPGQGGVFLNFFGRPVPVSPIVDTLASNVAAPVMPVFCKLQPDGGYLAYGGPLIEPEGGEGDPIAITRRFMAVLEAEIAASPGFWNWMYMRWKFIPPGEARERYPFYARPVVD